VTPRRGGRDHGRGTLVLDRTFPGVGRIKRASGVTEPKFYQLLDAMLVTLYKGGRLDLLRAIKDGTLTPLEVWSHFRLQDMDRLPRPETLKPFRKTALAWAQRYKGRRGQGIHERHRYELVAKLRTLADCGPKGATVAEAPALLLAYRAACEDEGTHRTFNYAKAALQAFLRATVGRRSPVYVAVADVEGLEVRKQARRAPHLPEDARALRERLGDEAGAIWWGMCCSGMGPTEFWGRWETRPGLVLEVFGTKRAARHRRLPLVTALRRPGMTYGAFRRRLAAVTDGALVPYDARRAFTHWMEQAGIPRTRRRAYLGHAIGDVTELYERHEVDRYLAEDGAALRGYVGEGERPGLALVHGAP
jgi:hypothetical protein